MKLPLILAVLPLVLAAHNRSTNDDYHENSIIVGKASTGGCRKKHADNVVLPGGAEACTSHKPLKMKGIEKAGKRLCAEGYEYCSVSHKSLHRISWKTDSMPKSCFGFHYRKEKFAGYGKNCHRNLYFDGLLCCPSNTLKTSHRLKITSDKVHHYRHLKDRNANYFHNTV